MKKKKTISYVSKVNKKNTFLMENNNKMLYMSKVIKKWVQGKKIIYIPVEINYHTGGID